MKYSNIGGQAVMEGIMMKNKSQYSVAVRRPDGEIEVKTDEYVGIAGDNAWAKLPLIRGMVNFIDSMILGMKTLSWSASFYEDEEEEQDKDDEYRDSNYHADGLNGIGPQKVLQGEGLVFDGVGVDDPLQLSFGDGDNDLV